MKKSASRQALIHELHRGNQGYIAITLLFKCITAGLNIALAYLLQQVLDVPSGQADFTFVQLFFLGVGLLLSSLFSELVLIYTVNAYSQRAMRQYRAYAFQRITQKSLLSFSTETTSRYLSALTNDATKIQSQYVPALYNILYYSIEFLGALALMFFYSWQMTLVVLLLILLPLLVSMLTGQRLIPLEKKVSHENERFIDTVKDLLSGFSVIKSFQAEKQVSDVYNKQNETLEKIKCTRRRADGLLGLIGGLSGYIAQIGIFFYGTYLAIQGNISLGIVLGFVQMMNYILQPISELPSIIANRKAAQGLIDKLAEALDENVKKKGTLRPRNLSSEVRYENVAFAYSEENGDVLKGVDLHFEAGKSYAIVGASGCGKSTLLSLLLGAYDHYRGSITLDGHELRDIDPDCLYDLISVIQQNVFIFNSSIRENVTMFKEFEDAQVESALNRAGLQDLIAQRGKDFLCGENGAHLSGGERQRISIARSLLREAPILLMDEALSALDAATAASVIDSILSIDGLTRIIVTHKMDENLLRPFDEIIVLANGKATETGTFDQLMAQKGRFYSLMQIAQGTD
ncbi:MAG: ABC transporter ATP-binding protein [Clostridiales bacterium]|nr:ABC transporter ATP-binding protein [Clostridiales bacterium]